jgi:hypothetical protein
LRLKKPWVKLRRRVCKRNDIEMTRSSRLPASSQNTKPAKPSYDRFRRELPRVRSELEQASDQLRNEEAARMALEATAHATRSCRSYRSAHAFFASRRLAMICARSGEILKGRGEAGALFGPGPACTVLRAWRSLHGHTEPLSKPEHNRRLGARFGLRRRSHRHGASRVGDCAASRVLSRAAPAHARLGHRAFVQQRGHPPLVVARRAPTVPLLGARQRWKPAPPQQPRAVPRGFLARRYRRHRAGKVRARVAEA